MTTNRQDKTIVCLACEDYWYHPIRSRRHYMERLAKRGWRVLFVNSIGMRAPSGAHPDFWLRVRRKLKSWARWARRPDPQNMPTFWVGSPIALPFFNSALVQAINKFCLPLQIRAMMIRAGVKKPVLWVGNPAMITLKDKLGEKICVLHASDKYDAYGEIQGSFIADSFQRLVDESDLIVSASKALTDEFSQKNQHSVHLPHGIDADHFSAARLNPDLKIPDDLAAIPRPRLGFIGSVDQVIEHDLIALVAEKRPDLHQVFVGHYSHEVDHLRDRFPNNVHFLGGRPYSDVPAYLRGFDIGIMPWKNDEWIRHCNPLKLKEYLLAGRPCVTTPFEEVASYRASQLLHVAGPDPDDYLAGIDAALEQGERLNDTDTGMPRKIQETRENEIVLQEMAEGTWDKRTDELETLLLEAIGRKG